MTRHYPRSLVLLLGTVLSLGACDDNPSAVESPQQAMARLAGDYAAHDAYGAIAFTTVDDGETTDWLDRGALLQLRLAANGGTTGRLFVPGADEDGGDLDAELTGRWTLRADTIHFEHEADTFIRDIPFRVEDGRLVGDRSFGAEGVRVRVELVRR